MHLNFPGSLSSLFRLHQAETWHAPWRRHCNSLLNSSPLIFLEARQHGEAVFLTLSDPAVQTPAAPTDFSWSQSYLQRFPKIRPCAPPVPFEHRSSLEALGMLFVEASKAPPDLQEGKGGQDRGNTWVQLLFPPMRGFSPGLPFTPSSASSLIPKEVGPCSFALLLPPMHQFLSSLCESWLGTVGKIFLYSQFWRKYWVKGMQISCIPDSPPAAAQGLRGHHHCVLCHCWGWSLQAPHQIFNHTRLLQQHSQQ